MRVKILIVCLCVFSFNAMAQQIKSLTWQEAKEVLPESEFNDIESRSTAQQPFSMLYDDGLFVNTDKNTTLFTQGYFSIDLIKDNPDFLKQAADYKLIVIDLDPSELIGSAQQDLSMYTSLEYIVVKYYNVSDWNQIFSDFQKLNQSKGNELKIIGHLLEPKN
ncbi:hypothetical protein [Myroides pelagicus]|uniref:Uncharacterized protein n=1 Tax=Myroides pelagicus TaxID=270914 RepID=A0A7K1GPQ4_9FLAO|nr:hypothetical protein [Myroides pelagicus]MTH30892.1 hypothetical protein [Myroides pelagicus]